MSDAPKIIAVREWAILVPFFVLLTIVAFVVADNRRLSVEKAEAEALADLWRGAATENNESVTRCHDNFLRLVVELEAVKHAVRGDE